MPSVPPLHGLDPRDLIREGFSALRGSGGLPWSPPSVEELSGMLHRYEVLHLTARGGMGAVYEARDRKLGRRVALKLLPPEMALDARAAEQFRTEERALAAIQHPHIVTLYDAEETAGGSPFFVMEFVAGENLAERMQRGPVPQAEALAIICTVAGALAAAHGAGVLHRDMKPSNILLGTDGRVRVADFGLAMMREAPAARETESSGPGTQHYAAPEQLEGREEPSPRADVYSLGVVACELLTGARPQGDLSGLLRAAKVDRRYDAPLLQALATEPERRMAGTKEFLEAIQSAGRSILDEQAARLSLARTRRILAIMAVLAAAASALALISWHRGKTIEQQRGEMAREENAARVASAATEFSLANQRAANGPAEWRLAIAHMARALRLDPDNRDFGPRLYSLLSSYGWPEPVGNPLHHAGPVRHAVYSPDGKKVATASDDGTAQLWDALTTLPLGKPMPHEQGVRWTEFSPDGRWVATASDDGTARVWSAADGEPVSPPLTHGKMVRSARFRRQSDWLVTASQDGSAQVWDAASGKRIGAPLIHEAEVMTAVFSPDGARVLTASTDHSLRLWEASSGRLITRSPIEGVFCLSADFNADGSLIVATLDDGVARVLRVEPDNSWTRTSDCNRRAFHPEAYDTLEIPARFSPDGNYVVAECGSGVAGVWRSAGAAFHSDRFRHRKRLTSLGISPDSSRLLTGSRDGTAALWDIRTAQACQFPMHHDGEVTDAAFSPDGRLVVTASADGTARIWRPRDSIQEQHRLATLHNASEVWGVAASPDGRLLAAGTNGGDVLFWKADTLEPAAPEWNTGQHVFAVDFAPDSQHLVAARRHHDAQVWDITERRIVRTLWHLLYKSLTARYSPDGHLIAVGAQGAALIWNVMAEPSVAPFVLAHTGDVHDVAWTPDGLRLATACSNGRVQFWDAATGKALPLFLQHDREATSCDISPNGQWVATGSHDRTARVWDAVTGQPVSEPMEHPGRVRMVRFSPDGRHLATVCETGEVMLWDALTGHALRDPFHHDAAGHSVVFTRDGRRLLSGADATVARVWELGPGGPAPAWLPEAAEKLAGVRIDEVGRLVPTQEGWSELADEWRRKDSQEAYAKLFRAILSPSTQP